MPLWNPHFKLLTKRIRIRNLESNQNYWKSRGRKNLKSEIGNRKSEIGNRESRIWNPKKL